jgi:WD40 repeat protein
VGADEVGADEIGRLWDLTDPYHPVLSAILPGLSSFIESVAFGPNGHTLASGGSEGTIRLWDTNPDQTAKDICALSVTPLTRAQWQQYIPGQSFNPPCESDRVASPVMPGW